TSNSSGNNTGNGTNITILPVVNLTITKIATITTAFNGDTYSYIVTVTNYGPDNATNVLVSDILDTTYLTFVSTNDTSYDNSTGIWNISTLNIGHSASLTIVVKAIKDGVVNNFVNLSVNETNVNNKTNDSVNVTIKNHTSNLSIKKLVKSGVYHIGDVLTYTIVITNNGLGNSSNIIVKDYLSEKLIYVTNSASNAGTYVPLSHTILWTLSPLSYGENHTLTYKAVINGIGIINNSVGVSEGFVHATNSSLNDYTLNTFALVRGVVRKDTDKNKSKNDTNKTKDENETKKPKGHAGMKHTGLPLVMLLVIFTLIGCFGKKQKQNHKQKLTPNQFHKQIQKEKQNQK
ncbi:MAG: DUF11 domain-containing protein, partial [Methanobrevibacter sp.]|nr:DUF11 domain-containing protein [Methanobrevibacter sp.]